MSHATPAAYMVWSILSCLLGLFLVFHLWSFDRFRCLRWNHGSAGAGAFKRLMTYSYLFSLPLIICYAVGFAIIKYSEGYIFLPEFGILPKPYQLWSPAHQRVIFPLYLCLSIAWSLEMVIHLEELCFWLFVVNASLVQRDWFKTSYFKTWAVGSVVAIIYMPLIAIFTRSDPLKSEACMFLAGSLGSLSLTIGFIPILWRFPRFLRGLRQEGVDMPTIVRLTKFHELNTIRVAFRFLYSAPFVILGIDGARPHQHINDNMAGTDLLTMIAGFGLAISSGLTLTIFFPRSIEAEIQARDTGRAKAITKPSQSRPTVATQSQYTMYDLEASPIKTHMPDDMTSGESLDLEPSKAWLSDEPSAAAPMRLSGIKLQPNRRPHEGDIELGSVINVKLTEGNLERHNHPVAKMSHFVHSFRSPIDLRGLRRSR